MTSYTVSPMQEHAGTKPLFCPTPLAFVLTVS